MGGFDDTKDRKKTTVIIKHMFTLDEMFSDPNFRVELEEDVEAECGKFGAVDKVKVFTTNPEGVVSVRFKDGRRRAKVRHRDEGKVVRGQTAGGVALGRLHQLCESRAGVHGGGRGQTSEGVWG